MPIRVEDSFGNGDVVCTIEANRRYELASSDDECRRIDITSTKGTMAYGFCAETDEQIVLDNVPELVRAGELRPLPDTD